MIEISMKMSKNLIKENYLLNLILEIEELSKDKFFDILIKKFKNDMKIDKNPLEVKFLHFAK